MRRSSDSKQSSQQQHSISKSPIDWELRPGGMVVQKREEEDGDKGPTIKIKIHHGTSQHQLNVHPQSTFGELKRVLAHMTGLEPQEQRVLFHGKEKDDEELLHMAGVKDTSKLVLLEDPASRERKLERMNKDQGTSKACEAVVLVRSDVDKLVDKIAALESAVNGGTKVEEKEFLVLTESLMVQLLKLDGIEAEGEAKAQRKLEVRRVQSFVDKVDALKARNSNPFSNSNSNSNHVVAVTTQWETFESGAGSLSAPPAMTSSTTVTNDWEHFD